MNSNGDTDFSRTVFSIPMQHSGSGSLHRMPVLVVLRGAQVGRRYLLNESGLVLGRRPDHAALVVPGDAQISSRHCRFERESAGAWQVVDLGSTNGTLIAGQKVTAAALHDGERIVVGETVLKFTFHDEIEEEFHRAVDHLMNVDDLTGLPVQREYQVRCQEALTRCAGKKQSLAIYMMDMDGLKKINDTHGHLFGANSIATIGRRLGKLVQAQNGCVSRFGGDEFSAFVPGLDRDGAIAFGERMRAAVADEPVVHIGVTLNPTMSIGLACFPSDGTLIELLTRQADEALYRAKAAGRNRVST